MSEHTDTITAQVRDQVRRRRQRTAALMGSYGIDALIVDSPAAIAYLSDVDVRAFANRSAAVVLREDGEIVFVASEADAVSLDVAEYTGERALWAPASERTSALATLCGVVRRSAGGVRIGVERAGIVPADGAALFGFSYPPGTIVPADELLAEVMRIKDEDEIARLREAGVLAEIAYTATVDRMHPELRVYEIVRNVDRSVRGAGGGGGWWSLDERPDEPDTVCFPHGAVAGLVDRRPESGVLDRGAALPFQVHPLSRCYTGAAATTIVLQAPDEALRSRAEKLSSGIHAATEALRPGTTGGEVHRAFAQASAGTGALGGFSLGTGPGETLVAADAGIELLPRMVLALRAFAPGIAGRPGILFETAVLVTDEGAERLDEVVPLRLIELY